MLETVVVLTRNQVHSVLPFALSFLGHAALFCGLAFTLASKRWVALPKGASSVETVVSIQERAQSQRRSAPSTVPIPKAALEVSQSPSKAVSESKPGAGARLGDANGVENAGAVAEYLFGLRRLIDSRKIYPALARKMGEKGLVVLGLEVERDGAIRAVRLNKSSGFSRLDEAALKVVSGIPKYEPLPEAVREERLSVEVPIEFTI